MQLFKTVFINYSYQWIVGLFFTFLSFIAKKALDIYKKSIQDKKEAAEKELRIKKEAAVKESQEQTLMKEGLLALLRFRVNRICQLVKEKGYITIDQKLDLIDLYKAYESLGGNSRTHILYEETIKSIVKDM